MLQFRYQTRPNPEAPKTRLARVIDDEALDAQLTATCWL